MSVLYDHSIASFDDSIQPTGTIHWTQGGGLIPVPVPHVEMKKLHHELHLVINGPSGSDVSACINQAAFTGLLAGLVAAYVSGGAGIPAAETAAIATLTNCLGNTFQAKFDDHSDWVTWDT
jgi:hypothetical protein